MIRTNEENYVELGKKIELIEERKQEERQADQLFHEIPYAKTLSLATKITFAEVKTRN